MLRSCTSEFVTLVCKYGWDAGAWQTTRLFLLQRQQLGHRRAAKRNQATAKNEHNSDSSQLRRDYRIIFPQASQFCVSVLLSQASVDLLRNQNRMYRREQLRVIRENS